MKEEIESLLKKLVRQRRNPLLLLNLVEVSPSSVLKIEQILRGKKFKELDVFLQTNGGDIHAAYNIVKLLRKSPQRLHVLNLRLYPSHDSIIDKEELKELGLPIEKIEDVELDNLSDLAVFLLSVNEEIIEVLENRPGKIKKNGVK